MLKFNDEFYIIIDLILAAINSNGQAPKATWLRKEKTIDLIYQIDTQAT